MATYTATIQDLALVNVWEGKTPSLVNTKIDTVIEAYRPALFDFDYNFPGDVSNKAEFERFFIRYYYLREIGYETENIFKMRLQSYIDLYYEKWRLLYEDFLNTYDIRIQQDMTTATNNTQTANTANHETMTEGITNRTDATGTQDTTQATTATDASLFSDTADDRLSIKDGTTNLVDFASTVSEDRGQSNTTGTASTENHQTGSSNTNRDTQGTGNSNMNSQGTSRVQGMGIEDDNEQYRKFQAYFKTFYEIVMKDLQPLFMALY